MIDWLIKIASFTLINILINILTLLHAEFTASLTALYLLGLQR